MKTALSLFLTILTCTIFSCGGKSNDMERNGGQKREAVLDTTAEYKIRSGSHISADSYYTGGKDSLYVTLVGHGSLMFEYRGMIIHVDPYSKVADYSKLPDANLILLTHEHSDHLDITAIEEIATGDTKFIMNKACNDVLGFGEVIGNNEVRSCYPVDILAVPAYNIVHKKPDGEPYHPKGQGNGYLIKFGQTNVYVAGDTENIPEMDDLKNKKIDIAFMPKNLPYTMSDEMFIDAARKVQPTYLYPYHMSEFDKGKIRDALSDTYISLVVRPMSNL